MALKRAAYVAFASFGSLWGVWGAALPQVQQAARVSDGRLGTAMLLTGRAVDRFCGRTAAVTVTALALSGVAIAAAATSFTSLALLLLLLLVLGATSGATDVAINAVAGAAERATGQPVLTRAHGTFSAAVVVSSLTAGVIEAAGLPVTAAFGLVVVTALAAAVSLWPVRLIAGTSEPDAASTTRTSRNTGTSSAVQQAGAALAPDATRAAAWLFPLAVTGLIGALALAVENACQSWGAVFLRDQLSVAGGLAAAAPAVFAAFAAAGRFTAGASPRLPAGPLLTAGALIAAGGTVVLARSGTVAVALAGLALAAAGTSVLFPTLLREALGGIRPGVRGRATSAVTTTAYLGFLLGPVYVGGLASAAGLRDAMLGVAALAVLTAVTAWPVARWAGRAAAVRSAQRAGPAR
jgi:MFS family permease